jgi:hypothetical protein
LTFPCLKIEVCALCQRKCAGSRGLLLHYKHAHSEELKNKEIDRFLRQKIKDEFEIMRVLNTESSTARARKNRIDN